MKTSTLLLLASLVANVALVSLIYTSRSSAAGTATNPAANKSAPASRAAQADAARAAAPGDPTGEAAGLSPEAARDLALGRAMARYSAAMRGASGKSADGRWWVRTDPSKLTREQRDQLMQARREMSEALIAATGSDYTGGTGPSDASLAFLPETKRDQLRKVLSDYQEMMDQYGTAGGIQLASDREKMKLLRAERERDIAALLSPEELAAYQLRTSPCAETVRSRYGSAIQSEEDFKKIYALQKAYDDKFPAEAFTGRISPDLMRARTEAAQQLQTDLRAAVGDQAYAALRRASDSDLRNVDALVARLSLAPDTVDRVATSREGYAAESQRIMADTATPFPQRSEQLKALATRAKSDLSATLGTEAGEAYAQRAPWVSMLQSGIGFSTTPTANSPGALSLGGGATQSVFPVMPAGAPGTNVGARQIMNVITSDRGPGPDAGAVFFSAGGPAQATSTQVISVSSATMTEGHGPSDTSGAPMTRIIVAPPAEAPAPPPPPKE